MHHGVQIAVDGHRHRIDFVELTGKSITVYGQQEVVKDLIAARLATGAPILFDVVEVSVARRRDANDRSVRLRRTTASPSRLTCDVIAGCDGFHGICRPSIPADGAAASTTASTRSPGSACWPRPHPPPTS